MYGEDVRTEVLGTDGTVFVGRMPLTHGAFGGRGGVTADSVDPSSTLRFQSAYAAQVAAFVRALVEGGPVTPDGADATAALRIALAARRSAAEGRPVPVAGRSGSSPRPSRAWSGAPR